MGKKPPIDLVRQFLDRYGLKSGDTRFIRTDQGGELARSDNFRQVVAEAGYTLKPTGSDAPSENGLAERPNQTIAALVRRLLFSAGLPPKYWADAYLHSVYLYNRTLHRAIGKTPYKAHHQKQPDLSRLRVFGNKVACKIPG